LSIINKSESTLVSISIENIWQLTVGAGGWIREKRGNPDEGSIVKP
jgi:hypothetical protein